MPTKTISFLEKVYTFVTEQIMTRMLLSWGATFISSLFGMIQQAHYAVGVLIILDTITGVWRAAKQGKVKSSKMFYFTFRKIMIYLIFIAAVHQIVRIETSLELLRNWSLLFLGATELISILENLHEIGFLLPPWVSVRLHKILDKDPFKA